MRQLWVQKSERTVYSIAVPVSNSHTVWNCGSIQYVLNHTQTLWPWSVSIDNPAARGRANIYSHTAAELWCVCVCGCAVALSAPSVCLTSCWSHTSHRVIRSDQLASIVCWCHRVASWFCTREIYFFNTESSTFAKSQCVNVTLDRIKRNTFISLFPYTHCGMRTGLWQPL